MRYVAAKVKDGRVELDETIELPDGADVIVAIPDGRSDEFAVDDDEATELDAAMAASGIEPSFSVDEVLKELRRLRAKIEAGDGAVSGPDR